MCIRIYSKVFISINEKEKAVSATYQNRVIHLVRALHRRIDILKVWVSVQGNGA